MIIDFDSLNSTVMPNFKGGKKNFDVKMFCDENNKIMFGTLEPGASIGKHMHDTNSEIIYIINGSGKVLFDEGSETVLKGNCHYCPKGHSHSLINDSDTDLVFFAVVAE